jgi:hypothetical protein
MTGEELREALRHFTALVLSVGRNEISLQKFLEAYQNFYHYYALDGHESDAAERCLLDEQAEAIDLHRRVQEEVLSLVYMTGDWDRAALNRIGRIDPEQAQQKLAGLCADLRADEILRELSA